MRCTGRNLNYVASRFCVLTDAFTDEKLVNEAMEILLIKDIVISVTVSGGIYLL